jgi:hypothetical protein
MMFTERLPGLRRGRASEQHDHGEPQQQGAEELE